MAVKKVAGHNYPTRIGNGNVQKVVVPAGVAFPKDPQSTRNVGAVAKGGPKQAATKNH